MCAISRSVVGRPPQNRNPGVVGSPSGHRHIASRSSIRHPGWLRCNVPLGRRLLIRRDGRRRSRSCWKRLGSKWLVRCSGQLARARRACALCTAMNKSEPTGFADHCAPARTAAQFRRNLAGAQTLGPKPREQVDPLLGPGQARICHVCLGESPSPPLIGGARRRCGALG